MYYTCLHAHAHAQVSSSTSHPSPVTTQTNHIHSRTRTGIQFYLSPLARHHADQPHPLTQSPPPRSCLGCDNIKLLYDPATKTYTNNLGVTTRTPGWGDTTGFEYLDTSVKAGGSDYLHDLVAALVGAGYPRLGLDLGTAFGRAHPRAMACAPRSVDRAVQPPNPSAPAPVGSSVWAFF